jgi:hypothetical protein
MDTGDTDRLFTFEVTKTNEQEENAIASPGFKVLIPVVVKFILLMPQRCIAVTFRIIRLPRTVRLTLRFSFPAFYPGKLRKAF